MTTDYYKVIRDFTKHHEITHENLAEAVGVSYSTLTKWIAHQEDKRVQPSKLAAKALNEYMTSKGG